MDAFQRWMGMAFLALILVGLVFVGCTKKYSVTAVSASLPTATVTPTPAPATPTATSTPCNPAGYQTSYSFENNIECWHVDSATSIVTSLGYSDNQTHNDSKGSLQASINNNTGSPANAQLEVSFATPQNMSYAVIHLWLYVSPGLAASDWSTYLVLFDRNSGNVIESSGVGISSGSGGNAGQWVSVYLTVGSNSGSDPTQVNEIGAMLVNIPAGGAGNLYIDDITITYLPTLTPTPATTCAAAFQEIYTFDSSLECWRVNTNSQPAVSALDIAASPARRGAGSMRVAVSQPSEPVSVQLELQYSSPQTFNHHSAFFWVYVDPGLVGCAVEAFVQSGTNWKMEAGGWTEFNSGNVGTWVPVQFTLPCIPCGGGDPNNVKQIGLRFTNMPPSASGNIYVDDFRVVPYFCTASTVEPSYTFESSYICWQVNPAGFPIVYEYDLSSAQSHEGVQSLHISIAEPSSPLDLQVGQKLNYLDFTGKSLGFWVFVGPSLSGCSAEIFTISGWDNIQNSGGTKAFDSSNTGQWVFMSWTPPFDQPGENSTVVSQIGVRFTNLPASASGDVYIDEITIP